MCVSDDRLEHDVVERRGRVGEFGRVAVGPGSAGLPECPHPLSNLSCFNKDVCEGVCVLERVFVTVRYVKVLVEIREVI